MLDPSGQNSVLVLPTYNEAENIETFIRAVRHSCPSLFILIVDDESPDGTGIIADRLARELKNIEVIHRVGVRGLGSAYRAGFSEIADGNFEAVITMDADFSHDPAVIPQMLATLQSDIAIVIGSRYITGGEIRGWPLHRKLL
ncbi:MAG: glycosyltransferase, partial [Ilumatobacteraceae bacterium]